MDASLLFADLPLTQRLEMALRAPGAVFVTGEDNLRIRSLNAATGVTLSVTGRFWRLDGTIESLAFRHVPNTNRTLATTVHTLGAGWLLDVRVIASAGTPIVGQCWALLELVRGFTGAITDLSAIVSGYVTANQPLAWPGSPARGTLDGPGALRSVTGTNPAAGVEISETVPTGARWRLNALASFLTPDATVANRTARLLIDDGTNILWQSEPGGVATAGAAWRYTAGAGIPRLAGAFDIQTWSLPTDLILLAGWRVRTLTASLQAADDWDAPFLLVEEWIEGA